MSTAVFLEESSEKQKRGRPRLLSPGLEEIYRSSKGAYCAPRTVQNEHYHLRAFIVLGFSTDSDMLNSPYRWLCDVEKQRKGYSDRQGYRRTILIELGRIADDEELRAVALRICEIKPKARDAAEMIRHFRCGLKQQPNPAQLANEIIHTINSYKVRYPGLSSVEVLDALEGVRMEVAK